MGAPPERPAPVRHLEAYHAVAMSAERLADQLAAAVLAQTLAAWVEVTVPKPAAKTPSDPGS
jgi:hypothetical protein